MSTPEARHDLWSRLLTSLAATFLIAAPTAAQSYTISTLAGGALPVNIPASGASLYGPQSAIASDSAGNIYFADGNTVLRLTVSTGLLTLIAGNGNSGYTGDNGPAVSASLHAPYGIAVDAAGNLYIACAFDNVVREVSGGIITTVAGTGSPGFTGDNGPAVSAQLNSPYGLALDSSGTLYIVDSGNASIRKVSGGIISTVAGNGIPGFGGDNGPATSAQLNSPQGVVVDASGTLYIADTGNNRIRQVSGGLIVTIAGTGVAGYGGDNGPAPAAQLNVPCGIALDSAASLYIADYYNNRIRKVSGGMITTVAGLGTPGFSGDGGLATNAQFNDPFVVALDPNGNLYIADYGNDRIREVSGGVINTVAGNGTAGFSGDGGSAIAAQLHYPGGMAIDAIGNLYFADYPNNRVRRISDGIITTVAGSGTAGFGGDGGIATSAELSLPSGVALDSAGNLYIADTGNNRIRKVTGSTISTFAGNGTAGFSGDNGSAVQAELNQPAGIAFDVSGNLYIADAANNRIRKVAGGNISTIGGNGAPGFGGDGGSPVSARLFTPSGVAVDSTGNIFIADSGNNRIRKVSGSVITTVAGNGSPGLTGDNASAVNAELYGPAGVETGTGGALYIADTLNNVIRKVSGGTITTIAGGGASFGDGGPALSATLSGPQTLSLDSAGNIYVADKQDNRIRLLTPVPLTIASPSSLSPGTVGTTYPAVTFSATGGTGTYTWSVTGLPKGITFTTAGVLSGTPTAAATSSLQFTVKDSSGSSATLGLSLVVSLPVPSITSLSPASATVYGATFTLTVTGTGFASGDVIQWNNTPLTTKYVSATQLTASISSTLIATAGSVSVTVTAGAASSIAIDFPVNAPIPTLTTLKPSSAVATSADFTLTLTGTGFVASSLVQWNASPLSTTFVSATQLTASVPASLIANAGSASVTVSTGQVSSQTLTFAIGSPPAVVTLSPSSVAAYSGAFTLTVNGTGFTSGAVVQWNYSPLSTKFVSATQLSVSVPAGQVGGAGSVSILVTSGSLISNTVTLAVNPSPPAITSLSPASAVATGASFTLAVNGTGFTQDSGLQWNGAPLTVTFVSATQLTAYIPASLIATAGSASIVATAGSVTSAAAKFQIAPAPSVTSLSPASVIAGSPAFTLTLTGTGFVQGLVVQWNGAPLPTTFVSATQLSTSIPTSQIASPGSVTVQVGLGGSSFNGLPFLINAPPSVTGFTPTSAAAGGPTFTLTVNGTGFITGSAITWNGTALSTKLVNATQLTASVTAGLIASPGSAVVAVSVGTASAYGGAFPINPPPMITSLSPATVVGAGAPFTLTVNGSAFASGATVNWNGTALSTTFVSSTQLTAAVPANTAAGAGTASIVASNPGSQNSAAVKLPITAAQPAISPGGVVPIYSANPVVQPGSWISIYGSGLANGTYVWTGNFPTALGGTSVKINNKAAYLWVVSPTQINLQAPIDSTTGIVNVVVTTAAGSATSTVTLAPYGPSFSMLPGSNYAAGVILTPSGTGAYGSGAYDLSGPTGYFSFNTRPVKPGEILELFGVGFGPTSPSVPAGKAYTGAAPTTNPVAVTIGGVTARVLFSGITEAGLYQFNVTIPNVGGGDQPLLATVGGASTPSSVLLTVQ